MKRAWVSKYEVGTPSHPPRRLSVWTLAIGFLLSASLLFFAQPACGAGVTIIAHGYACSSDEVMSWQTRMTDIKAQVPQMINYQGRASVAGTNFDGTGQFKFALVNDTGATTYWSNGNSAVSLTVTKGLYAVLLGDTSIANMSTAIPVTVFNNADCRLRVWFNDGVSGLQLLSADQRIAAAGYYAELGQFANAVSIEQESIALLTDGRQKETFIIRLKLYQSNSADRERGYEYHYYY